jgi:hypothetical protein
MVSATMISAAKRIRLGTHRRFFVPLPYFLSAQDITEHKHIIGKTRQGKSSLIAHYAASLIMLGIPVAVIDPQTDLSEMILALLEQRRFFDNEENIKKLLYVDFSREDRFVPLNILNQPYDKHTIAANIVDICERAWPMLADGSAPLFEQIMLASIPVLIENNLTLVDLEDVLTNASFRAALLARCSDHKIVSFFRNQFDAWGREQAYLIGSTTRRAFLFTMTPALRYSLGQQENLLSFSHLMNNNMSVICALGGLSEQTQKLLGCVLTVGFEQAAESRAKTPHIRSPYQLIIDEFPKFLSNREGALTGMLERSLKFGMTLTLINQNVSQIALPLQGALQNTITIAFKLGYQDAKLYAPLIGSFDPYQVKEVTSTNKDLAGTPTVGEQYEVWAKELEGLNRQEAYVRTQKSVKIKTMMLPNLRVYRDTVDQIKQYYADLLLTPRDLLEQEEQRRYVPPPQISKKKRFLK